MGQSSAVLPPGMPFWDAVHHTLLNSKFNPPAPKGWGPLTPRLTQQLGNIVPETINKTAHSPGVCQAPFETCEEIECFNEATLFFSSTEKNPEEQNIFQVGTKVGWEPIASLPFYGTGSLIIPLITAPSQLAMMNKSQQYTERENKNAIRKINSWSCVQAHLTRRTETHRVYNYSAAKWRIYFIQPWKNCNLLFNSSYQSWTTNQG